METKNRIITIFTYLVRALLAYVYIPHGLEKLYTKINVKEYIDFKLGQDFINFYLIWEKNHRAILFYKKNQLAECSCCSGRPIFSERSGCFPYLLECSAVIYLSLMPRIS
jgi:hypothetical protein